MEHLLLAENKFPLFSHLPYRKAARQAAGRPCSQLSPSWGHRRGHCFREMEKKLLPPPCPPGDVCRMEGWECSPNPAPPWSTLSALTGRAACSPLFLGKVQCRGTDDTRKVDFITSNENSRLWSSQKSLWWIFDRSPHPNTMPSALHILGDLCMLSRFSHVRLFVTPMDCSLPGSSVHGIFQARILEWVAMPSSRGSSWARDQTCISYVACIGRQVFTTSATWEAAGALWFN